MRRRTRGASRELQCCTCPVTTRGGSQRASCTSPPPACVVANCLSRAGDASGSSRFERSGGVKAQGYLYGIPSSNCDWEHARSSRDQRVQRRCQRMPRHLPDHNLGSLGPWCASPVANQHTTRHENRKRRRRDQRPARRRPRLRFPEPRTAREVLPVLNCAAVAVAASRCPLPLGTQLSRLSFTVIAVILAGIGA